MNFESKMPLYEETNVLTKRDLKSVWFFKGKYVDNKKTESTIL